MVVSIMGQIGGEVIGGREEGVITVSTGMINPNNHNEPVSSR
jgi:hypothetical protein